ncbi:MAG: hypothetical protein OXC38_06310 [Gammaproteobacteria bacterium]|nr:hypothetical protein [Gammaproteobacteria bacterium]
MANNPPNLSFSQRYGHEPLPEPMQLEHLSKDLRREIWNAVRDGLKEIRYSSIEYTVDANEPPSRFFARTLGTLEKIPEDEVPSQDGLVLQQFKSIVMHRDFNIVLDLIERLLNSDFPTAALRSRIPALFEKHAAAYRLDMSQQPYWFYPQGNREQGEAIQQSIETIHQNNMDGATTHLRQAVEHINAQQYADSITDSIHAVESVARQIAPKANTLGTALNFLIKEGSLMNPVLKKAFEKLYGYTNSEQGVRHALLDQGSPNVGLDEAVFMYGACASFAAYLTRKYQQVAQQGTDGR